MSQLKDEIKNMIDDKFLQLALNEYHWDDNSDASTSNICVNMVKFLNTDCVKKISSELKIFTKTIDGKTVDAYSDFQTFINNGLQNILKYNVFFDKNSKKKDVLEEAFRDICIPILNTEGYHFLPFYKKSNDFDKPDGNGLHTIGIVINTIVTKSFYEVYFMNSGFGASYHDKLVDHTFKDDAIIKKSVDYNVMYYFMYFFLMSEEIHQFYNTAMSILSNNSIKVKPNMIINDNDFKTIQNELESADTFIETQQIGNCSYRSLHIGMLIYIVFLSKQTINNFEDWNVVLKLQLIKAFFEDYKSKLLSNSLSSEYYILNSYVSDIYAEIYIKIQSSNVKFNNMILQIDKLISDNIKLSKYTTTVFNNLPELALNNNIHEHSFKTTNIEIPLTISPLKDDLNTTLESLNNDINIIGYYNLFNSLKKQSLVPDDNYFKGQDINILSSSFNMFYSDMNMMLEYMEHNILNKDQEILNPYILLFYIASNSYARIMAKQYGLKSISDTSNLNSLLNSKIIPSENIYELTKSIVNQERIKGNYFEYLTTNNMSLFERMYMGCTKFDILKKIKPNDDFSNIKYKINTIKTVVMNKAVNAEIIRYIYQNIYRKIIIEYLNRKLAKPAYGEIDLVKVFTEINSELSSTMSDLVKDKYNSSIEYNDIVNIYNNHINKTKYFIYSTDSTSLSTSTFSNIMFNSKEFSYLQNFPEIKTNDFNFPTESIKLPINSHKGGNIDKQTNSEQTKSEQTNSEQTNSEQTNSEQTKSEINQQGGNYNYDHILNMTYGQINTHIEALKLNNEDGFNSVKVEVITELERLVRGKPDLNKLFQADVDYIRGNLLNKYDQQNKNIGSEYNAINRVLYDINPLQFLVYFNKPDNIVGKGIDYLTPETNIIDSFVYNILINILTEYENSLKSHIDTLNIKIENIKEKIRINNLNKRLYSANIISFTHLKKGEVATIELINQYFDNVILPLSSESSSLENIEKQLNEILKNIKSKIISPEIEDIFKTKNGPILFNRIFTYIVVLCMQRKAEADFELANNCKTKLENILTKYKQDEIVSTQYNLNFILKDIIGNPYGELRTIYNINSLYPNYYYTCVSKPADINIDVEQIGTGYNYMNHYFSLGQILDISLDEIYGLVLDIGTNDILIQKFEKYLSILMYLYYLIDSFINRLGLNIKNQNIIIDILDELNKSKNKHNINDKQIETLSEYINLVRRYYSFYLDKTDKSLNNSLMTINYSLLSNHTNFSDVYRYGINYQMVDNNKTNLGILGLFYSNQTVKELYHNDFELQKIVSNKNIRLDQPLTISENYYMFSYNGIDYKIYTNNNRISYKKEEYEHLPPILGKNNDLLTNKYTIQYTINSANKEIYTIMNTDLLKIPTIILNNYIISKTATNQLEFELINKNLKLREYVLQGKIENKKWSITIKKNKKTYNLLKTDSAIHIVNQTLLSINYLENYLVFSTSTQDSYIILIPETNTEYFVNLTNSRSYLNNQLIVNNDNIFYHKAKYLQNFIITKDDTSYYINYLNVYNNNDLPVISNSVYYILNMGTRKYTSTVHTIPAYYKCLKSRYIEDISGHKHMYMFNQLKFQLLTVSFELNNDKLGFTDIIPALDILYMTSSVGNYYFSKSILKFISSVLNITDVKKYENRLGGYYPFLNLIFKALEYNLSSTWNIKKLIILNRNSPIDCKMTRSFFNIINSDEFNIENAINGLAIAGLGQTQLYTPMFTNLLAKSKYSNFESKSDLDPNILKLDLTELKSRKNILTFDAINLNFICREVCFTEGTHLILEHTDYDFLNKAKAAGAGAATADITKQKKSYIDKDIVVEYLGYKKSEPNIENRDIKILHKLSVVGLADQIKWDKIKFRNVRDYILIKKEVIDQIIKKQVLEINDYPYLRIEPEATNQTKKSIEILTKINENLSKFAQSDTSDTKDKTNVQYKLLNEDTFRNIIHTYLIQKLKVIRDKLNTFKSFKTNIDNVTKTYTKLMNNRKLAEMLFYMTLDMKYTSDLYKLGYNSDGIELDSSIRLKYNLTSNINVFMNELLNIPGYISIEDDVYYIKVNSIFIFFDYYFNISRLNTDPYAGTFIRKNQYDLIISIVNDECKLVDTHKFHQLIMGAGKSSYIAPLLSVLLVSMGMYPIHIMPAYLVEQAKTNMKILEYFGIKNVIKEISRQNKLGSLYLFNEISGNNLQNINFIMSDATLKSILLNNAQTNEILNIKNLLNRLKNGFIIMDEVDDISDPFRCELNYPNTGYIDPIELLDERIDLYINILKLLYLSEYRTSFSKSKRYENYESFDESNSNFNIYYLNQKVDSTILSNLFGKFKDPMIKVINDWLRFDLLKEDNFDILVSPTKFYNSSSEFNKKLGSNISDQERKKLYKKLFILYNFLFNIIGFCMSNINRRNFGLFDIIGIDRSKHNIFAVPFTAVETPNIKSEFSNIDITLTYTIISYLLNKNIMRKGDYDLEFREIYNYYSTVSREIWTASDVKIKYNNLCMALIGNNTDYDINLINSFDTSIANRSPDIYISIPMREKQIKVFSSYIKRMALIFIKEYKYQLNATFSDIASSDFCPNRTGFSGTPYFMAPIDKNIKQSLSRTPNADKSAEGSIMYSIINSNVNIFKINTYEDILLVLSNSNSITKTSSDITKYNTFIDVGAYCLGYSNRTMAFKFIKLFNNITHCVYLDEKDKKRLIDRKTIESSDPNSDKLVEDLTSNDKDEIKKGHLFVFFDQKHITGIDIPLLPSVAKGLISLKYTNSIRDYSQGAFRLRKINLTQSVDICIDSNIAEKINFNQTKSNTIIQNGGSLLSDQNGGVLTAEQMNSDTYLGHAGINNAGNTCFMSAAIQLLYSMTNIRSITINYTGSDRLIKALRNIFVQLADSTIPYAIKKYIVEDGLSARQIIHKAVYNNREVLGAQLDSREVIATFLEKFNARFPVDGEKYTVILYTTTMCDDKSQEDTNIENKQLLTFNLTKQSVNSIVKMIDQYTKGEKLIDENGLARCKTAVPPSNGILIYKYEPHPNNKYVIINLLRFNDQRQFDPRLIIANRFIKLGTNDYELKGAVLYGGDGSGGHYVFARVSNGVISRVYNDSTVSDVNTSGMTLNNNSYVLLYVKVAASVVIPNFDPVIDIPDVEPLPLPEPTPKPDPNPNPNPNPIIPPFQLPLEDPSLKKKNDQARVQEHEHTELEKITDFNTLSKQNITLLGEDKVINNVYISKVDNQNILFTSEQDHKNKLLLFLFKEETAKTNRKTKLQALHNLRTIYRYTMIDKGIIRLLFADKFPNLGMNIFTLFNTINLPYKSDIDFSVHTLMEKYAAESEYMVNDMNEIGTDNELKCLLTYLYKEICSMRPKSKVKRTYNLKFELHNLTDAELLDPSGLIVSNSKTLYIYPEVYLERADKVKGTETDLQKLKAYNIYNSAKNKFNTVGLQLAHKNLSYPYKNIQESLKFKVSESISKRSLNDNIDLIIKSAIIGKFDTIKILTRANKIITNSNTYIPDGIDENIKLKFTTICSKEIFYNLNSVCISFYSDKELDCTTQLDSDNSDFAAELLLSNQQEAVAEQSQEAQQENQAEIQEELQQEEELQKLAKQLKLLFNKLVGISRFYMVKDIMNPPDKDKIINCNQMSAETLVNFGFIKDIVFTKLYLYRYCFQKLVKPTDKPHEICFKIVYNVDKKLFIIMTQEEYLQLYSIWDRLDISDKHKLNMHMNYNRLIIPGIRSLIDYMTDKNINILSDVYPMIDKLIDYSHIDMFKLLTFNMDAINNTVSSETKITPKIKEKSLMRLIVLAEKFDSLTIKTSLFDKYRDFIFIGRSINKLHNLYKIKLFENIYDIKKIIKEMPQIPETEKINIYNSDKIGWDKFKVYSNSINSFDKYKIDSETITESEWQNFKLFINSIALIPYFNTIIQSIGYYLTPNFTISTYLKPLSELKQNKVVYGSFNYEILDELIQEMQKISAVISKSFINSANQSNWSNLINHLYHKTDFTFNKLDESNKYDNHTLRYFRENYQDGLDYYHPYVFNEQIYVNNLVETLMSNKSSLTGIKKFDFYYPESTKVIYHYYTYVNLIPELNNILTKRQAYEKLPKFDLQKFNNSVRSNTMTVKLDIKELNKLAPNDIDIKQKYESISIGFENINQKLQLLLASVASNETVGTIYDDLDNLYSSFKTSINDAIKSIIKKPTLNTYMELLVFNNLYGVKINLFVPISNDPSNDPSNDLSNDSSKYKLIEFAFGSECQTINIIKEGFIYKMLIPITKADKITKKSDYNMPLCETKPSYEFKGRENILTEMLGGGRSLIHSKQKKSKYVLAKQNKTK